MCGERYPSRFYDENYEFENWRKATRSFPFVFFSGLRMDSELTWLVYASRVPVLGLQYFDITSIGNDPLVVRVLGG